MKLIEVLSLVLGITILCLLIYFVNPSRILLILLNADIALIIAAFFSYLLVLCLICFKQQILFAAIQKFKLSFLFEKILLAWSYGMIIPGKIGDFFVAYLLRKELPIGKSVAVVFLDKLVQLFTSMILAVVFFLFFFNLNELLMIIAIFFSLFVFLYVFIFSEAPRAFIRNFVLGKYQAKFEGFNKAVLFFLKEKRFALFLNFFFVFLKMASITLMHLFLFASLGYLPNFFQLFIVINVATIISVIPLTPSALGLRQLGFVGLLSIFLVPIEISSAVAVLALMLDYIFALLIFLFSLFRLREQRIDLK